MLFVSACTTGEEPRPFDLTGGDETETTEAESDDAPGDVPLDDPNAGPRSQAQGFAEQQCIDDPTAAEGIIEIAEQDTGEVVNRIVAECDDVRARAEAGEPVGYEIIPEPLRPQE